MTSNVPSPRFGSLYWSLAITVALPLALVLVLQNKFGMPAIKALAIAAVIPLADILIGWVRLRKLQPLSLLILIVIVAGIVLSLISGDVRFALVKESFGTLAISLAFLGSLLAPRPLMFWLAQQFTSEGNNAKKAQWEERWHSLPGFRIGMRKMTLVWGLGYLLDAVLRVVIAFALPANVVIVLSPLLAIAITLALVVWTIGHVRRAQARAA
ncbi:MAG TPA: VC0807 family protein [Candidatus Acidoferrales bacterium]|nr:VC0807 family protein [Candidatus Acidoferrales bacterium]